MSGPDFPFPQIATGDLDVPIVGQLPAAHLPFGDGRFAPDLYGAFPVKRLFWVVLIVFCSERERPFFVPSPAIRFAERAEGVKGPKR